MPLNRLFWAAVFAALLATVLLPYAINGFWADDALNSQMGGMINRFDTSVLAFSGAVVRAWLFEYGRVLLPWPVIYSFFYAFQSEWLVRLLDMAMFMAHLGLTAWLLRRMRITWRVVGLFALFLLALLQIRDPEDPLAAYAGFSQGVGCLLMITLLLLHKWSATQSVGWLAASSLLAAASMTFYEVNAVYVPIALVAIFASQSSKRVRDTALVVVPFFLFMAASLYVKKTATNPYAGSAVGTLAAVPVTFFKQLLATLPGSFYLLDGKNQLALGDLFHAALASKLAWCVMLTWTLLSLGLLKREHIRQPAMGMPVFAACTLLLVPPLLIAISAKYQAGLIWGHAHIPVYYQYFGLAFLLAFTVDRFARGGRAKLAMLCAPLCAIAIAMNWVMNMHQSAIWDAVYREPRDSLVQALHNGLLDGVREGDVLRIEGQPIFINGNLIYQTIGKNLSIPDETATAGWFESAPRADAKVYSLVRDPEADHRWQLLMH